MSAPHLQHLAQLIANDGHAATFQSLAQYRSALLKEIAQASAAPMKTTSDQYRAELYDEMFEKARSMGFGNIIGALTELERMKTSAAPEQEAALTPAAYRTIDEFGSCTLSIGKIHQDSRALVLADHAERLIRFGRYEVERLRADKQYLQRTIDGINEAHAEVAWRLSEAQALLRELHDAFENEDHPWIPGGRAQPVKSKLDVFLSATAQPAEVKS